MGKQILAAVSLSTFEEISMRGRVAYALMCWENTLQYFQFSLDEWRVLLDKYWTYTDAKFIDVWQELIVECTASNAMEEHSFEDKEISCLNIDEYNHIRALYRYSNGVINRLSELIFYLGSSDDESSIEILSDIVALVVEYKVPLPDQEKFRKFSFSKAALGDPFKRKDIEE